MLLLYQKPPRRKAECTAHLHSTMLLLYLCTADLPGGQSIIYIPLCFYFIRFERISSNHGSVFTFHYASTLSKSGCYTLYNTISFTFHYASTLSLVLLLFKSFRDNLHSTMLLLYLGTARRIRAKSKTFTFHYASTLSISPGLL